ncbi:MAG: EamA family transporter [Rhodomicrobiaceae bacterium]
MKKIIYALFILLLAIDTFNQVAFKMAGERTAPVTFDANWLSRIVHEPWIGAILGGYLLAFLIYMTLLRDVHVGPAFAASHMEIVTVVVFSVLFFGERFAPLQVAGCAAILAGVAILAMTETQAERENRPPAE